MMRQSGAHVGKLGGCYMKHGADWLTVQSSWLTMMEWTQQDVVSKPGSPLELHPAPPVGTGPQHSDHRVGT